MSGRTWLLNAGRRRAALEVGLLAFALALPLIAILRPAFELTLLPGYSAVAERWLAGLNLGMVYVGYFGALLGAVRLRRGAGRWWWRTSHEVVGAVGLVLAVWTGALLADLAVTAWEAAGSLSGLAGFGHSLRSPTVPWVWAASDGLLLAYPRRWAG